MLPDDTLIDLRQEMRRLRDGRCVQVDVDGCRCLVKVKPGAAQHPGPCDFSYTPWRTLANRTLGAVVPHPDTLVLE